MRFHWSLPGSGVANRRRGADPRNEVNPVADLDGQRDFCRRADELGIDSLLLPIGFQRADGCVLAAAFGLVTKRVNFMPASRAAVISPTHFVQQINTVSAFTNGRVEVNVVSGQGSAELRYYGDFSTHDERYQRTDEFWTICHALWRREFPVDFAGEFISVEGARVNQAFVSPDRHRPYIYIGGSSEQAQQLAIKHADCQLRLIEPPEEFAPKLEPALAGGIEVGVTCNLVVMPTHEEAVDHVYRLAENAGEAGKAAVADWRRMTSESVGFESIYRMAEDRSPWLTPYLFCGLVPYMGPQSISLVGSPDEIVDAIFEYRRIGVTQFMFQGRPDFPMLEMFGSAVLPKIREREAAEPLVATGDLVHEGR
ncbi:MAG TPA: LLM class flavin-dependent oxidoreductase [Actinophytocola sp.]|uniref:LLM class flavin-dependent oxidoreductase n=1 Tax=Actinophytocola sp. TaxID=1872138 RepID=UPI002DBB5C08|nr:LLM class flavin-dependent oxidoreductase [Actinophytocola sp.]HEU5475945.1 LLM class flavin-dependent oxidoreductase [Actinophytocola sp.]